jgi:hypothetical protein
MSFSVQAETQIKNALFVEPLNAWELAEFVKLPVKDVLEWLEAGVMFGTFEVDELVGADPMYRLSSKELETFNPPRKSTKCSLKQTVLPVSSVTKLFSEFDLAPTELDFDYISATPPTIFVLMDCDRLPEVVGFPDKIKQDDLKFVLFIRSVDLHRVAGKILHQNLQIIGETDWTFQSLDAAMLYQAFDLCLTLRSVDKLMVLTPEVTIVKLIEGFFKIHEVDFDWCQTPQEALNYLTYPGWVPP